MMIYFIAGFFFIWLVLLTYLLYKTKKHYNNLVSNTKKNKIDEILDELLKRDKNLTINLEQLKKQLNEEIKKSQFYFQKIGLIRYNPFDRLGSDQSFIVALLNKEKSGIILNFIYTKEGLRVYTKKVKEGKGDEYELSDEEKKAIDKSC